MPCPAMADFMISHQTLTAVRALICGEWRPSKNPRAGRIDSCVSRHGGSSGDFGRPRLPKKQPKIYGQPNSGCCYRGATAQSEAPRFGRTPALQNSTLKEYPRTGSTMTLPNSLTGELFEVWFNLLVPSPDAIPRSAHQPDWHWEYQAPAEPSQQRSGRNVTGHARPPPR
jgi:hypothetical protein